MQAIRDHVSLSQRRVVRDGLTRRPLLFPDIDVAVAWAEEADVTALVEPLLKIDVSVTRQLRKKMNR